MSLASLLLIMSFQLLMSLLLLLMFFLPVAVLTLLLSLLVPFILQQASPAVAGALPAARTLAVVDVHACMLAVAVHDNTELASLLSLRRACCWAFLPGARGSTVQPCIFPLLVPGPDFRLWFLALVPTFGS